MKTSYVVTARVNISKYSASVSFLRVIRKGDVVTARSNEYNDITQANLIRLARAAKITKNPGLKNKPELEYVDLDEAGEPVEGTQHNIQNDTICQVGTETFGRQINLKTVSVEWLKGAIRSVEDEYENRIVELTTDDDRLNDQELDQLYNWREELLSELKERQTVSCGYCGSTYWSFANCPNCGHG